MDDLQNRADKFLRGPCCMAPDEPWPKAVGIIRRYVKGELWDDPALLAHLPECLRYAQAQATDPANNIGPAVYVRNFYTAAASLLQEIQSSDRVTK